MFCVVFLPYILLGDLNNGLVAWYPFDGNASDMSGNGKHGTVHGATLGSIVMAELTGLIFLME